MVDDFTYEYAINHLMGSAGKQDSSGDLDFALNNRPARFIGEPNLPVFNIKEIATRAREVLPEGNVNTKTLRGGQFQSAWLVEGKSNNGLIQVDFIIGDPEWLLFSHFSPGKDISLWKGVMISTMLGVLAKVHTDFELFNESGERIGKIGWQFDLEKGLYRKYKLRLRPNQGLSEVSPDYFETKVSAVMRLPRLGHLTHPDTVNRILFDGDIDRSEIDTFEKIVKVVKTRMPERFKEIKERFLEAFTRSAGQNDYKLEDVANDEIWR
jgi:hypothetical protein